eukprot:2611544-Pyramimonas_sp.AAC.2
MHQDLPCAPGSGRRGYHVSRFPVPVTGVPDAKDTLEEPLERRLHPMTPAADTSNKEVYGMDGKACAVTYNVDGMRSL